jgi:hypothetical protein
VSGDAVVRVEPAVVRMDDLRAARTAASTGPAMMVPPKLVVATLVALTARASCLSGSAASSEWVDPTSG